MNHLADPSDGAKGAFLARLRSQSHRGSLDDDSMKGRILGRLRAGSNSALAGKSSLINSNREGKEGRATRLFHRLSAGNKKG